MQASDMLRQEFQDFVVAVYETNAGDRMPQIAIDEKIRPPQWLCGQLWRCTDMMPPFTREILQECAERGLRIKTPEPMTYAQGVRLLKRLLAHQ